MNKLKDTHETQSTEQFYNREEDKLFTPIEDLQKIEAGGVYKRNVNFNTLPKGIKIIGYFLIGFFIVTGLIGIIISIFD